ncbi:unnamed protein product [Protopolystoma xenopodis]|uniref:Uncharacterized protein n=1 Tax=Protopolystoma xenopodis TaxID=117903 RepID=A0A448WGM2_9PLAT|nr:unnamed protein product [Protopolystoma xenopodis]
MIFQFRFQFIFPIFDLIIAVDRSDQLGRKCRTPSPTEWFNKAEASGQMPASHSTPHQTLAQLLSFSSVCFSLHILDVAKLTSAKLSKELS